MDKANHAGFSELKQIMGEMQTTLGAKVEYLQINMERNRVESLHQMEVDKHELKEDIKINACQCNSAASQSQQFRTNDGNKKM